MVLPVLLGLTAVEAVSSALLGTATVALGAGIYNDTRYTDAYIEDKESRRKEAKKDRARAERALTGETKDAFKARRKAEESAKEAAEKAAEKSAKAAKKATKAAKKAAKAAQDPAVQEENRLMYSMVADVAAAQAATMFEDQPQHIQAQARLIAAERLREQLVLKPAVELATKRVLAAYLKKVHKAIDRA